MHQLNRATGPMPVASALHSQVWCQLEGCPFSEAASLTLIPPCGMNISARARTLETPCRACFGGVVSTDPQTELYEAVRRCTEAATVHATCYHKSTTGLGRRTAGSRVPGNYARNGRNKQSCEKEAPPRQNTTRTLTTANMHSTVFALHVSWCWENQCRCAESQPHLHLPLHCT